MTPLALQHGVVICWRFHWIMVNCINYCTWPAIVHSTQDWMALRISVSPRKPSVHHYTGSSSLDCWHNGGPWKRSCGLSRNVDSSDTFTFFQSSAVLFWWVWGHQRLKLLFLADAHGNQRVIFHFKVASCAGVLPCKECSSLWPSFLKLFSSNLSSSGQPCLLYNFCFSSFLLLSRKSHQLFQKYTNQSKSATKCKQLTSHLPLFFKVIIKWSSWLYGKASWLRG